MHKLVTEMGQRIQSGLARKAITEPSRWACKYRYLGHPYPGLWTFDHHPWSKDMHDSKAEVNVGQKAAQVGYTEWGLNIGLYMMDIHKMDVLYVLPNTRPDAADFSSSRFDKAVELSKHLQAMFSDVQNVGHKKAGTANLFIRGSNSRSGMMSLPVSLLILDELDEMEQDNISLAEQRLKGQIKRLILKISTPTLPDYGINSFFVDSTQEHWQFRCPSCSRYIELKFPDNIVITAEDLTDPRLKDTHLICNECKAVLPHENKIQYLNTGKNVPYFPGRDIRGFTVNQMYAMHLHPSVIATDYLKSLKDEAAEQVFYNATLGLPHIVKDAQVTDEMLEACMGTHRCIEFNRQGLVTMGVDVNKTLNVEICMWHGDGRSGHDINSYARCTILNAFEVDNFEDLDRLMFDFNVNFCVIDLHPERRKALEFANRFPGRVLCCIYPNGINGRNLTLSPDDEKVIRADRTSWIDMALGRFKTGTITMPQNIVKGYKEQIKAQVRIPEKDQHGNPINRYKTPGNRKDHYGHARTYAEIAFPLAAGQGISTFIRG